MVQVLCIPEQYILCFLLPYSTSCIYCQFVDVPLMVMHIACLFLGCYIIIIIIIIVIVFL